MKVKELIEKLKGIDGEKLVIMANDSEGNNFSPLSDIEAENKVYQANSTWNGEVGFAELTPELRNDGFIEEELIDGEPAIILFPIQ